MKNSLKVKGGRPKRGSSSTLSDVSPPPTSPDITVKGPGSAMESPTSEPSASLKPRPPGTRRVCIRCGGELEVGQRHVCVKCLKELEEMYKHEVVLTSRGSK